MLNALFLGLNSFVGLMSVLFYLYVALAAWRMAFKGGDRTVKGLVKALTWPLTIWHLIEQTYEVPDPQTAAHDLADELGQLAEQVRAQADKAIADARSAASTPVPVLAITDDKVAALAELVGQLKAKL